MMKTKIIDAVHFEAFRVGSMGFGMVTLLDTRFPSDKIDGEPTFIHKLSEKESREPLTEAETAEIKLDCDALVKLLRKFHHDSEFVFDEG